MNFATWLVQHIHPCWLGLVSSNIYGLIIRWHCPVIDGVQWLRMHRKSVVTCRYSNTCLQFLCCIGPGSFLPLPSLPLLFLSFFIAFSSHSFHSLSFSSSFSHFFLSFSRPLKYSLLYSRYSSQLRCFGLPSCSWRSKKATQNTINLAYLLWTLIGHIADGNRSDTMCNCREAVDRISLVGASAASPGLSSDGDSAHRGFTEELSPGALSSEASTEVPF